MLAAVTDTGTRFEALGGEFALRAIIDDFVERLFADTMIGFFFARASKDRIKQKEFEHAAAWLGAPIAYTGKPLREAHAKHPIMGGQFARRRALLERTLRDHGLDETLIADWLAHQDSLRDQVTQDAPDECNDARAAERARTRNEEER